VEQQLNYLNCPHHNVRLVLREAKHGTNMGKKFWDCPTWSKAACNYTIPYKSKKKTEANSNKNYYLNHIFASKFD